LEGPDSSGTWLVHAVGITAISSTKRLEHYFGYNICSGSDGWLLFTSASGIFSKRAPTRDTRTNVLMGYLGGFLVTLRQHGERNRVTTQYSGGRVFRRNKRRAVKMDEKLEKPERLHGRHVLNRYEDGMEKCIGCELCAAVCPAKCIHVRGADNDPTNPTSPGERFGWIYEINYLRCIHCDLCVEACPTEAITETKLFEFSFINRQDAIYTKNELLVDNSGKPQQLAWEDWREGEDQNTSGWMRATASSGDANFTGVVSWSGELGYGVRPAEEKSE